MLVHFNVMFHVMQRKVRGVMGVERYIQHWKKVAEEREDEVKKNEEFVRKLEKKREQYEGELCVVLWNRGRITCSTVLCIAVMVSIATCCVGIISIVISVTMFEWIVFVHLSSN